MTGSFHAGERALQARVGLADRMADVAPRAIRDLMPEQHRSFFAQLPFVVLGSVDATGQPWVSALARPPGFVSTPQASQIRVQARPAASDPLARTLAVGASMGLLGIEPHTRRRNRANGTVSALDANGFTLDVAQSFGNCPKYIQAREPHYVNTSGTASQAVASDRLDALAQRIVESADTFYIATAHPQHRTDNDRAHGVDVSHRGGKPGFVRVSTDANGQQCLTVPDFAGNFFFNTLGNVMLHPLAGLLFVDFDNGDLWHVAVQAEIVWDAAQLARFAGAQRLLRMHVRQVVHVPAALALRWGAAELSPALGATGSWA
jgi:predicted pyridoxine 5'-phosphate oxidase superfamily flavin-nucleotide-binding protein